MATQTITITSGFRNGGNCIVGSDACAHAEGFETSATGNYSHSEGVSTKASAEGSHSSGVKAVASHKYATVWNGDSTKTVESSSEGTFILNPVDGASGLFIGSKSFQSYLDEKANASAISATDTTFSCAVTSVSAQFDAATVGDLNGLPSGGVATVGASLSAAFAAIVALNSKIATTDAKVSAANETLEANA